jgi:hypothetical protein
VSSREIKVVNLRKPFSTHSIKIEPKDKAFSAHQTDITGVDDYTPPKPTVMNITSNAELRDKMMANIPVNDEQRDASYLEFSKKVDEMFAEHETKKNKANTPPDFLTGSESKDTIPITEDDSFERPKSVIEKVVAGEYTKEEKPKKTVLTTEKKLAKTDVEEEEEEEEEEKNEGKGDDMSGATVKAIKNYFQLESFKRDDLVKLYTNSNENLMKALNDTRTTKDTLFKLMDKCKFMKTGPGANKADIAKRIVDELDTIVKGYGGSDSDSDSEDIQNIVKKLSSRQSISKKANWKNV